MVLAEKAALMNYPGIRCFWEKKEHLGFGEHTGNILYSINPLHHTTSISHKSDASLTLWAFLPRTFPFHNWVYLPALELSLVLWKRYIPSTFFMCPRLHPAPSPYFPLGFRILYPPETCSRTVFGRISPIFSLSSYLPSKTLTHLGFCVMYFAYHLPHWSLGAWCLILGYVNVAPRCNWGTVSPCLKKPYSDRNFSCRPSQAHHTEKCGWYFCLAVVTKKLRADQGGDGGLWP